MTRERPPRAAPKGNAKTLRQKDRIRTGLRRVRSQAISIRKSTPKGQPPGCGRESLRFRRRQKDKRCLSVYFYTRKQGNVGCEISTPLPSSDLRETPDDTSALRCPKNAAHIRLLAFFVLPPFVRFADISPAGGIFRCGNSGFASERLAAFAVGGPVSRRPANGAAAEIPVTLFLPPAARNRNPATGSAKPQFPRRGEARLQHSLLKTQN